VIAVYFVLSFLVLFGYDVLFETLHSGRTPGKQLTGLRVVREGGAPVRFLTSAVRNLLRLVDILPTAYLVGMISILATARNQRLGDLAAGTLVVRDRGGGGPSFASKSRVTTELPDDAAAWDLSSVTADEVATVRRFLDRRAQLLPDARARLAYDLSIRLRPKVSGPADDLHPEVFLEQLSAAKAARA
jgi:hypothetical protein